MKIFEKYLTDYENFTKDHSWYIVKQDSRFVNACFCSMIIESYNKTDKSIKYEDYFVKKAEEIKLNFDYELTSNYRATNTALYYGLLKSEDGKYTYKNYITTNVYKKIKEITNGNFKSTELYKEIIISQLEKLYIPYEFNTKKTDDYKIKFDIYITIFLYKILLEIYKLSNEYKISIDEYRYFIIFQNKYKDYLKTILLINHARENPNYLESIKMLGSKFSDSRFHLVFEQLPTLKFSNNNIEINLEYIEHVKRVVSEYESGNILNGKPEEVLIKMNEKKIENDILVKEEPSHNLEELRKEERQIIFYGAPGTGKSFTLNEKSKKFSNSIRITFHPSSNYSSFVGAFKPFPLIDDMTKITYKFIPGSFLKLLIKAILNPNTGYLLIIEEINRANVASVFGDIFQLLDRNSSYQSEYSIEPSEDIILYINELIGLSEDELQIKKLNELKENLYIPENLFIWASMNSADQGVMPLDTAFKRRWNFEYFGVDDKENNLNRYYIKSKDSYIKWDIVRNHINDLLMDECNISEDKLMGPFFISKNVLDTNDIDYITNVFKDKVLMYLFEDAAKYHISKVFNNNSKKFSKILEDYDNVGIELFNKYELIKDALVDNIESHE
ncbi:AAA family ATPase [Macrococcoides caseolyticum]|uniref:AAA family ATPase n=1 Tax=Macrococcoides caseolyticum TaxID=69966 RepID=UPI0024BCBB6B|nr:AAA family ATPase [Macrococcus caseolyticus]MDJ1087921.1 AAA family ATPase [Macrococcus caseolyticus]